jgi:hypothetical protein
LFDHPGIQKYQFQQIPLHRDIFLMDEKWMPEYEQELLALFEGGPYPSVGSVSYAAATQIDADSVQLSWYPNIYDRYHEVKVTLPKDQFVACVDRYHYDGNPRLFVNGTWLQNLHLRAYSIFALIDAIGVKKALRLGQLKREKLIDLRDAIDTVADRHRSISFVSFADTILLKSNWFVGQYDSKVKYTYRPEVFFAPVKEIRDCYRGILDLDAYAILTQGSNEYYEDSLLHISKNQNHISLNSLGLPFAQLLSIDSAVRKAIKSRLHAPADLYMDAHLFYSLKFLPGFARDDQPRSEYKLPVTDETGSYFFGSLETTIKFLDPN